MSASTKTAVAIASGVLALGAGIGVATTRIRRHPRAESDDRAAQQYPHTRCSAAQQSPVGAQRPAPSSPPPGTEQPGWPTTPTRLTRRRR